MQKRQVEASRGSGPFSGSLNGVAMLKVVGGFGTASSAFETTVTFRLPNGFVGSTFCRCRMHLVSAS